MPDHRAILSGIKVIELATFVFGPGSTAIMGDFGADVMTALCRRERTGTGSKVCTSLMANGLWGARPGHSRRRLPAPGLRLLERAPGGGRRAGGLSRAPFTYFTDHRLTDNRCVPQRQSNEAP